MSWMLEPRPNAWQLQTGGAWELRGGDCREAGAAAAASCCSGQCCCEQSASCSCSLQASAQCNSRVPAPQQTRHHSVCKALQSWVCQRMHGKLLPALHARPGRMGRCRDREGTNAACPAGAAACTWSASTQSTWQRSPRISGHSVTATASAEQAPASGSVRGRGHLALVVGSSLLLQVVPLLGHAQQVHLQAVEPGLQQHSRGRPNALGVTSRLM